MAHDKYFTLGVTAYTFKSHKLLENFEANYKGYQLKKNHIPTTKKCTMYRTTIESSLLFTLNFQKVLVL